MVCSVFFLFFFFSSRRRHTRCLSDWSSDVCSADLYVPMQWRGWYDFGCGALGDMACHVLGAPNMALMLSERAPTTVECTMQTTKSPYSFPMKSIIRFDFPAYKTFPALKLFWHDGVPGGLPDEFWPRSEERRVGKECRSRWS